MKFSLREECWFFFFVEVSEVNFTQLCENQKRCKTWGDRLGYGLHLEPRMWMTGLNSPYLPPPKSLYRMSRSKLVLFHTDHIKESTGLALYLFLLCSNAFFLQCCRWNSCIHICENIPSLRYSLTQYLISSKPVECCFGSALH